MASREDNIQPPYRPERHSALIIFCLLGVGSVVRSIVARFKIPISDKLALIAMGAGYAYISLNYSNVFGDHNNILDLSPKILLTLWIPVYIYKATYTLDTYLFFKNIHRILLLAVVSTLLSSTALGLIVIPAINHGNWTVSQAFLFGSICAPINPFDVIIFLKDLVQSKELCCILESEFLIGNGTLIILFESIMRILNGNLVELDEILLYISQIILGELIYGYICGRIISFFMRLVCKDVAVCLGFTCSSIYTVYISAKLFLDLPGYFTIFVTIFMLNLDKNQLTADMDKYITKFWELLLYISNTIVYIYTGSITVTKCNQCINFLDYAYVTVTYIVTYAARFCSILIMAPIFSAWGQQWNWQSTLIAIWSGTKSGISLLMAAIYLEYEADHTKPMCRFILTYITGLIILSLLINGQTIKPILKISGLLEITRLKQINLNNCLKLIMDQQIDTIRVLKLHKFYADANWPVVKSTTYLRYSLDDSKVEDDENQLQISRKSLSSDYTRRDEYQGSSFRESKDLSKNIKMKILHLRKQSYSRQLEYGKISMEAFKILSQSVFVALDKEDSELEIEVLKSLHKRKRVHTYIIEHLLRLMEWDSVTEIKIPRRRYRKICYKIVMNAKFQLFVYAILVIDASEFILRNTNEENRLTASVSMAMNVLFFMIYFGEFVLKILAHSYIYIWKHGLKFYFQSHWNKIEFCVLIMIGIETFFEVMSYFEFEDLCKTKSFSMKWMLNLTSTSVFLRFIFKMVQGFKILMPKFIQFFESKIDEDFSLAYDVGQGLVNAENEIIEIYSKSADPGDFDIRIQAEKDRVTISNILSDIQKNRPWIPITVKTRQAVQTILSDMKKSTYELKNAGRLNDAEFKLIERKIQEQFEYMRKNIKRVEPCSPAEMFKEIPWIAGDEESALFLYSNIEQYSFKPGDFIAKFGEQSQGIFIVVTGLFKLTYEPNMEILDNLEQYGALPVVDYKSTYRFDDRIEDYVVCGNTIGNIAILTNRPYSCSIVAEIPSLAYFIPIEKIQKAITRTKHKIQSLDSKMWKDHSSSIAISLLSEVPAYEGTNLEEMKFLVERSFVPPLKNFEIFVVCDMIEDIILIYGCVLDFDTKEVFIAPCYIPRDVQKLGLKEFNIEPKLLIIPIKDAFDFEVMQKVEDISITVTNEFSSQTEVSSSTAKFRKITKNAMMLNRARKSMYGFPSQILSDFNSGRAEFSDEKKAKAKVSDPVKVSPSNIDKLVPQTDPENSFSFN